MPLNYLVTHLRGPDSRVGQRHIRRCISKDVHILIRFSVGFCRCKLRYLMPAICTVTLEKFNEGLLDFI